MNKYLNQVVFLTLFCFFSNVSFLQAQLKFEIFSKNIPLKGCAVKIYQKNGILVNFKILNDTNSFVFLIKNFNDEIFFSVSKTGFKQFYDSLMLNSQINLIKVNLDKIDINDSNEIIIKSKPIWVSGDTTFYKAGSFKVGNERKLEDLVKKMPDFEIKEDGNLFYKNKKIDKIQIDGNELLADEVSLLLKNFPVHVIDNIQAIENYNSDRLSRNLEKGKSTILNIGLLKKFKLSVFGDVISGIGNQNRYSIEPTIYAVLKKTQAISINYLGSNDLLPEQKGFVLTQIKPSNFLYEYYPNFADFSNINFIATSKYIKNQYVASKNQISFKLNKTSSLSLFVTLLKDIRNQAVESQNEFFTSTNSFKRIELTSNKASGNVGHVSLKLQKEISKSSEFTFSATYNNDAFNNLNKRLLNYQAAFDTFSLESYKVRNSLILNGVIAKRKNEFTLHKLSTDLLIGGSNYYQNNVNFNISNLFQLPFYSSNLININKPKEYLFQTNYLILTSKNKKPQSIVVNFKINAIDINNNLLANNTNVFLLNKNLNYNLFSNSQEINIYNRRTIKILRNSFVIDNSVGLLRAKVPLSERTQPVYNFSMGKRFFLFKKINSGLNLTINKSVLSSSFSKINYAPLANNNFNYLINPFQPKSTLKIDFLGSLTKLFGLNYIFFTANFTQNGNTIFKEYEVKGNYIFSRDSISRKQSNSYGGTINISHVTSKNLDLLFYGSIERSLTFAKVQNSFLSSNSMFTTMSFIVKKTLRKKLFINFSNSLMYTANKLENASKFAAYNFNTKLIASFVVGKKHTITFTNQLIQNQNINKKFKSFFVCDFEYSRNINKRLSWQLIVDNISNQKSYFESDISIFSKSFLNIPFIPISAIAKLKFDF